MPLILDVALKCGSLSGTFLVTSAHVREAISELTRATVHLVSNEDLDGDASVGQAAQVVVSVDGAVTRQFHLVIESFRFDGIHAGDKRRYVVELVHELALLTLRSDVRMFQEKDAKEIVAEVLDGAGIDAAHVSFALGRAPGKRTYCVQYRETDFAFVSRLLEHEGIFYVIADDDASTHVTFADAQSAFSPIDGESALRLIDDDMHGVGVHDFTLESHATPDRVCVGDYNFNTPAVDLTTSDAVAEPHAGDWFEYPGGHQTPDEGTTLAKLRLEEMTSRKTLGRGRSDRMAMRAGAWFTLEEASRAAFEQKYVLRSVEHEIHVHGQEAGARGGETVAYENRFTCVPEAVPFRPPRLAPRPRLRGGHSAVVTGPSGSEIHTEALGRMKGKFFWDRVGKNDDTSSCWMRVGQLPIGGSMALARVGWEMAVFYLDGDPDRPTATARLYNAEKTSPYGYPGAKTSMALQTPSSPASGKSNEIRLNDGAGGMEFFVNASKDYDAITGNNKTEKVGVDEKLEVGVASDTAIKTNQKVSIGASQTTNVSADVNMKIGADRTKNVSASETVSVSGNITMGVTGSDTEMTGGSHTTLAALGVSKTSVGSHSLTVGGSMISAAGLGCSVAVAGAKSETIGAVKLAVSGGGVTETIVGAYASTVGGACVHAAAGNRMGSTKGPAALTVGGLVAANAGGKMVLKAKKISIKVLGVANFLGGGGILTLTPGTGSFVGLVKLDASGGIKISGNPNLVG